MRWIHGAVCFLALCPLAAAEPVERVQTFSSDKFGLTAVSGEITLPYGQWEPVSSVPAGVLDQISLAPAPGTSVDGLGLRTRSAAQEQLARRGQFPLYSIYLPCSEYARTHSGRGPASLADLDPAKAKNLKAALDRNPFAGEPGKELKGPFYFLIPEVPISGRSLGAATAQSQPLALELRPYLDDGKHYVLFNDGRSERRPIDRELLRRHGLSVVPVLSKADAEAPVPTRVKHNLYALQRAGGATVVVTLRQRGTGRRLAFEWPLGSAALGGSEVLAGWARARAGAWQVLLAKSGSTILRTWMELSDRLYGGDAPSSVGFGGREPARTADIFSVLGGRAAMRETLQMQLLRPAGASQDAPTIPVADLKGVEVKSHPFEKMLAGRQAPALPLADVVPADRFFVHFAKPSAFFPFLDHGAEFLFRAGSLATASFIDDDLKGRYLAKLGLQEGFGREFLASGEVLELALCAPDLFFIDGTDLSIIMRVAHPAQVAAKMKERGVAELQRDGIVEKRADSGRSSYWAWTRDLVVVGSSKEELSAILDLARGRGDGGLGRTAEFRFMLTRLPLKKETRAYAYFSDPFIRRMVGPRMKIGQLRRMQARAEMERLLAGSLLRRLDSGQAETAPDRLVEMGYAPKPGAAGFLLDESGSVSSPVWGKASDLKSIGAVPLGLVSASEAQAYSRYVDEYARYWRQYFDPIALRLDDAPDDALELSSFILPLLDSQLYDQVRGLLSGRSSAQSLRVPVLDPSPAFLLSLNLSEDSWVGLAGHWREAFSRYSGVSPRLFDLLGPGFHLAVQDGDPIIVLGNADLLGAFGGSMAMGGMMERTIPLLLSVLTRPCKLAIELKDEQAVLELLRGAAAASTGPERRSEAVAEFRQAGDDASWIYSLGVAGMVKIRFGVRVERGFLILSNIPWSQPVAVAREEQSRHRGARLQLDSGAVRLGLPGLYAAEQEQNQSAALSGMGLLYPFLLTGSPSVEDAVQRHAKAFGFWPLHPSPGAWVWRDGRLASTAYGDAFLWKQPVYEAGVGDFGLFQGIPRASVSMQFEDSGLRAVCRWEWDKTGKKKAR